jgi:hypothetical protein
MDNSPISPAVDSVLVPLDRIPTDAGAQARTRVRDGVVRDYAAAMAQQLDAGGLCFPPVTLFSDGQAYWLADGWHRVLAARRAGLTQIAAEVRPGTHRDALLFAVAANGTHGLPRSRADKRKAVALLLTDAEWGQWSDREIARRCQVNHTMVGRLRRDLSEQQPGQTSELSSSGAEHHLMTATTPPDEAGPGGAAAVDQVRPGPADGGPPTDALGIAVPEARAPVFGAAGDFREAYELFDRLAGLLDRIAQGAAGERYRQELVRTIDNGPAGFACPALRAARGRLLAAEPYCAYCPACHAVRDAGLRRACKACGGRGWTTRTAFDSCRESDRQVILQMRTANRT